MMKTSSWLLLLFWGITTPLRAADAPPVDHSLWDALLKKYVSPAGRVNYKGFVQDKDQLGQYLQVLGKTDPAKLSREEQVAFWINAYNAFTVDLIVRHYPIKSIQDLYNGKVWDTKLPQAIHGQRYSLNDIEKGKLLGELFDPRIHFAVNCASVSCPKLLNEAFVPDKLESQLNTQASAFVNDPEKNKITPNELHVSKIFDWYQKDFERKGSLIAFLNQYAGGKIKPNARISYREYHWGLNE